MSDGVKLAADVYRPTLPSGAPAPGHFPVILSQTPYGKRSSVTTQSMGQGMGGDGFYPYLVERGYIDVVADVRGTGSSEGDFSLFGPRERQDGVELARWAARLPGSTGRVGLAGSSYVGLNQIYTAARDTFNDTDGIFRNGGTHSMLSVKRDGQGGYIGTIMLGVRRS